MASDTHHDSGKSGPPKQNRNSMRHGLRSSRSPKGSTDLDRQAAAFRRTIEDEFISYHGREPNTREAALLLSASLWYLHSRKAGRWAAAEHEKLTNSERVSYSEAQARAMESCARALEKLGLPAAQEIDPFAKIYDESVA